MSLPNHPRVREIEEARRLRPIGKGCHVNLLRSGMRHVVPFPNANPQGRGVLHDRPYFSSVPFLVTRTRGMPDVVSMDLLPNPADLAPVTPPVILTDFYFFVWFDFQYKSQVAGIPDTVYTDVEESNFTTYLDGAGFGHPNGGTQFLEVDTGDGIYWDWHLTRIHLHGIASAKPSGWVPTDPLGPAPWYNASGNYEVSFDVYQLTTYPDLTDDRVLLETVTTTIAVNPAATNTPGAFITDEDDLPYDASYGSTALDRTWTYSDTLIPDPGGSGSRISYEFENLRFVAV